MRTSTTAAVTLALAGTLSAQKVQLAIPIDPSDLVAIPDYGNASIGLTWQDNSANEVSFEVERSEDGGAFQPIFSTIANVTGLDDTGLATTKEYRYRVRASNAAGKSAYTNTVRQNLKTVWPVPASHEVLHGWNDTLGDDAVDEQPPPSPTGFHMGVDIQRTGDANAVVAARGGVVSNVQDGPNGVVVITVTNGASLEYFQTNHTDNPTVALNDVVHAGQQVAEIDETYFPRNFTDHTHYVVTDAAYAALQLHPLAIYSADADKDPGENEPELFDHGGSPPGTVLYQAPGAAAGVYLTVDATHPLEGDADVIVELRDEQGTLPDQLPTKLAYWIDGPLPLCGLPYHDVKDATGPYVLYSWANAYFGDAPAPKTLSQKIVDYAQNYGPNIVVGTENYPWENYKHFIVTNTKGTDGTPGNVDATQYWNTDAEDDGASATSDHANYAGLPDTTKAIEARFQDGDYTIHVLASDLVHADEDLAIVVRLENFCPIVCDVRPQPGTILPAGTTGLPFASVIFNEPMDTTIAPQTIVTIDNGATLANVQWASDRIIQFDIQGLMDGTSYLLKVKGTVAKDRPGTPGHRMLDGNQDGTCGDDFLCQFSVASP